MLIVTLIYFFLPFIFSKNSFHCDLISGKAYLIGGSVSTNSRKSAAFSKILMSDLTQDVNLTSINIKWDYKPTISSPMDYDGGFVTLAEESKVLFFSGKKLQLLALDINTLEWKLMREQSEEFKKLFNNNDINELEGLQLIKDDNKNCVYIFGGKSITKNKKQVKNKKLFIFDLTALKFSNKTDEVDFPFDSKLVYIKNQGLIMSLGGYDMNGKQVGYSKAIIKSIDKPQYELITDFKDIDILNPSLLSDSTNLYLLGGKQKESVIYLLRLSKGTLVSEPIPINNLISFENPCLLTFNNYLIYTSGTDEIGNIINQIQVIDLYNMNKVTHSNINLNQTYIFRDPGKYGAMLGGVTGLATGLFFILLSIIYFFYIRKNKNASLNQH
ncbi:hypothetical protein K502DRAFT_351623 [Neoconidiobolus thromboides FSU 785]|nr:hypothetical protein K502DRAFT_351623 [Neoconidiobolus thromboides FSU 785]